MFVSSNTNLSTINEVLSKGNKARGSIVLRLLFFFPKADHVCDDDWITILLSHMKSFKILTDLIKSFNTSYQAH